MNIRVFTKNIFSEIDFKLLKMISFDVMFHAMRFLGIKYTYDDYPDCLKSCLHRKVWEDELGNVKKRIV